jgi:hypothetical protein
MRLWRLIQKQPRTKGGKKGKEEHIGPGKKDKIMDGIGEE